MEENLENIIANGALIIDVRTAEEYKEGHIEGSLNIPLDEIGEAMTWLVKDVPAVVVCASGSRSEVAVKILKANGFEEYGRLYAEFIQQQEQIQPEQQLKNTHIVLQGKSKGAIIADKTSHYLSEDLQRVTQRLLDSPAGHHNPESIMRWFKGAQVAVGLAVETLFSKYFDDLMKSMNRQDQAFLENLSKTSNIPMDDKEQMRLKLEAALADGLLLLRGSPLDTENNRSFIRQGIYDPLTFSPKRIFDIWQRHRKNKGGFVSFSEGRSLQAPYRSAHFSIHKRFERWKTILDYCQGATKNK